MDSGNDNTRVTLQDATQKSFFVECDDQFELLLDELGIREVIGEDDEALRTMWNNLKVREEYRLRTILLANMNYRMYNQGFPSNNCMSLKHIEFRLQMAFHGL